MCAVLSAFHERRMHLIPLRRADATANWLIDVYAPQLPNKVYYRSSTRDCGEVRNGSYSDMTDERIQKIKSAVEAADHISPEKKTELLAVLAKLKPAIAEVAQTSEEEAESISRFHQKLQRMKSPARRNDRKVLREFCTN